jgi:sec-independent protein translocase protein TatC
MMNHADSAPSNNATNASSGTMGLWSHLEELRVRLVRAALTIFILFVIALTLSKYILNILKAPLEAALPANMTALHFTGPMDVFMVNIQIAVLASVILGAPAWLYHFWKFLEPALHEKERKYVLPFIGASVSCFLLGILFSYFFMLPMALKYLVGIGLEVAAPIITITDYVSLVTVILLGFGVVFETPVLLVLLALLDLVSAETLAAQRRVTCVIILIIAAIITPPDPVSMLGMAIPCYLMYELSIFIIRFIKPTGEKNPVLQTESTSRKEHGDRPTTSNQYPDPKIGL